MHGCAVWPTATIAGRWSVLPSPSRPGNPANAFYLVLRIYALAPQVSATHTWPPPAVVPVG